MSPCVTTRMGNAEIVAFEAAAIVKLDYCILVCMCVFGVNRKSRFTVSKNGLICQTASQRKSSVSEGKFYLSKQY